MLIVKHENHAGHRITLAFSFGTYGFTYQSPSEGTLMDLWQYKLRKYTPEDWDPYHESVRQLLILATGPLFLQLLEFIGKA